MASKRKGTGKAPVVDSELAHDFRRLMLDRAHGKANAITAAEVCVLLGMPATESAMRVIRAIASGLPESGFLVVGDNNGYFIPAAKSEADDSNARLSGQIMGMSRRLDAVQRLLAERFDLPVIPQWRPRRGAQASDAQMPLRLV